MPGESHRGPLPAADERLVALADQLRQVVTRLSVKIGERNVLAKPDELAETADFIEGTFTDAGYEVHRQEYLVSGMTCCNLEAERLGNRLAKEVVVIGAHYDSVLECPAANDNGSGVAALLSLARTFSARETHRTLRFVAFVNEEPPYFQTNQMGSWVYAKHCRERKDNVVAMLSLETIGYYSDELGSQQYPAPFGLLYPSTGNFIAFVGDTGSGDLVRQVVGSFRRNEPFPSEGGALPAFIPGVGFSDHWSFWQEDYPALMVTDTAPFRYPYYHTAEDTVDKIDFERTARVVRGLEKVIAELVSAEG
jgi:hypothetical protein